MPDTLTICAAEPTLRQTREALMRRQHIRLILHVVAFIGFVFLMGGTMGAGCSQSQGGNNNSSGGQSGGC